MLLGICVMFCTGCEYTSNALTNKGLEKLYKRDYNSAITYFSRSIAIHGKNASAYYNRGLAKYCLQDRKGALADFDKALEIQPLFPPAFYNRAEVKTDLKDYDGAITDYSMAVTLDPRSGKALYNMGQLKINMKNYAGALGDFTKAIAAAHDDTEGHTYLTASYINRALTNYYLQDYPKALADLDSAVILAPNNLEALYNIGYMKYQHADYTGAQAAFTRILAIDAKYGVAIFYNGLTDIKLGYKDIGCGELDKASRLGVAEAKDTISKYCR